MHLCLRTQLTLGDALCGTDVLADSDVLVTFGTLRYFTDFARTLMMHSLTLKCLLIRLHWLKHFGKLMYLADSDALVEALCEADVAC